MPAAALLAAAVIALCGSVLLGWWLDNATLKAVFVGLTTMKANTAVGLALLAFGIILLAWRRPARGCRDLAVAAAGLAGLLGACTMLEYMLGVGFGIDELLFLDPNSTSHPFAGRMSPLTAAGMIACAASLVILALSRSGRWVFSAHLLAAIPAAIGFLSLAGYAYEVERLQNFGRYASVALHTGLAMSLLAAGILLIRSTEGWSRNLADQPIARSALLQIAPISILLPFVTGLLVVWGTRAGLYQAQFAPALFALATAASLVAVAYRSTTVLGAAEAEIRAARLEARQWNDEFDRSRSRYLALVEELPQLVWTCLPDGSCDYLSRQWVRYTGIAEAEQLGFGWLAQTHPDDAERTRLHWAGAVAGEHPYDIEYRLRAASGAYSWFKVRGTPIRDAGGGIAYWFGTCTDIQQIVEAREVLARSRSELEMQVEARTAELMSVEAQLRQSQKMEAVGQLTGGVAHDFNNLLTGITGSLELMQQRIAQGRLDTIDRYVVTAQGAARRAAALTQRLLAFSRQQTLDPRPTDLNRLADGMADLIRRTVGPAITVEVVGAGGLWPALVDRGQLENALLNLCINGRDAMPDGGRLTIETANKWLDARTAAQRELPAGQYATLSVTDTGTGMTPEVMRNAFDPFFTTKPMGEGTGLGLSMIYGFMRQSGGQVRIYSEVGQGTTVSLYLPRHHGAADTEVPAATAIASPRASDGQTVLVIDDEPTVRLLVLDVLGDLGYRVVEAADGAEGLRMVQSGLHLDLLITDVGLPGGMNGRQVADAARLLQPGLKVLFITGYAENAAIGEGCLGPETALLTKPFTIGDLIERLQGKEGLLF